MPTLTPFRVPDRIFRDNEAEWPVHRDRPGWADCRCACAVCGLHLTCEGAAGVDDTPLCVCHGAPWNVRGGACMEVS